MTKKHYFVLILILLIYGISFVVLNWLFKSSNKIETTSLVPYILLKNCDTNYQALGFTENGTSICLGKKGLITATNDGKEIYLLSKEKIANDDLLQIRSNFLFHISQKKLKISRITSTNALEQLSEIKLQDSETVLDTFVSSTIDSTNYLLISSELQAQKKEDNKSQIRVITVNNEYKIITEKILLSQNILKVQYANFAYAPNFIVTKTAYPFLESKYEIFNADLEKISTNNCKISDIDYEFSTLLWQTDCNNEKKMFSLDAKNKVIETNEILNPDVFEFFTSKLRQTANGEFQLESDGKIIRLLHKNRDTYVNFDIISQKSTRIGKRVYNCIDFGELPQISLRVCIPFYD